MGIFGSEPLEAEGGPDVKAGGHTSEEPGIAAERKFEKLRAVLVALSSVLISHTPVVGREGVEAEVVDDSQAVLSRTMHTVHSEHVESHGRHVARQGNVGARSKRVGKVELVTSGSHQPYAEACVRSVVRPSDEAYIEFLGGAGLVG